MPNITVFIIPAILIIVLVLVIYVISYIIKTSNKMERQKVKIEEADSGIDVALAKRFDVLTKLRDSAKSYLKAEQETLFQTIQFRSHMPIAQKEQVNEQMNEAFRQINVVSEAYPELKSSSLFIGMQKAIADTEEHLQAARRLYNSNVSTLNQWVVSFPSSVVANSKNLQTMKMFEVEAIKRNDVDMSI